jgi:hypothetical protein
VQRGAEDAQHPLQLVVAPDLLAPVGDHQHGGQFVHPTTDVPQHVKRRVVGPVRVLDDQEGRPRRTGQLQVDGVDHPIEIRVVAQRPRQWAVAGADGVLERSEHAGGQQIVAGAAENSDRPAVEFGQEGAQQAGLADSRLPRDQHGRARARSGPVDRCVQRIQFGLPLEQRCCHTGHGGTDDASGR